MAKRPPRTPTPDRNMGRVKHAQDNWRDHGSEFMSGGKGQGKGRGKSDQAYHQGAEESDCGEREAYGEPLQAGYRYLIGPPPNCLPSDRAAACLYLAKIDKAILESEDNGGWTRSEWRRLRALRAKWKNRAEGVDPRFDLVGNRRTGMDKIQLSFVRDRKLIKEMVEMITQSRLRGRGSNGS